ncbi:13961_t:CDS:2, partial [Racocetra persica]
SNSESIENFVANYEGYTIMKDWDEIKIRLVVGLYVAGPLCNWIRDIGFPTKYRERINQRYSKTYEEAKDWVIKIEKYEKSDEFNLKKANIIGKKSTYQIDPDVDDLANTFSKLKICRVSQTSQSEKGAKRISKFESTTNELTKLVKDIANNKSQPNPN